MKAFKITCLLMLLFAGSAEAQNGNQINVHADKVIKTISVLMTGACIEDVNHEIYGGIYSQMVFGESFQETPMMISAAVNPGFAGLTGWLSCKAPRTELGNQSEVRSWQPFKKGNAIGSFAIDSLHPYVGRQSQEVNFVSGKGSVGIENRGLNREGLYLQGQKLYEATICAKVANKTELFIALENEDGSLLYAETSIFINSTTWQKYRFGITPAKTALHARLSITLQQPGSVSLGYVFMQPGSWGRYKKLPLRKEVVDCLLNEKVSVLRYGGSMTLDSTYMWKHMIGEREKRQPNHNVWYPYATNGWGIIDFMNMCEAMGIIGIPDFNSGETPADMADFIEYENGDVTTSWGKKRAAGGHPAPYHLKYLELGNEQFNDAKLTARFKLLADAIWSKDPSVQIIFCLSDDTRQCISGDLDNLKKTILNCREKGHQAWFDVHLMNSEASEPDLKDFVFAEEQLKSVVPEDSFKLCVFEENADNARMKRGLGHANAINRLQRLKYDVPIVCAANCLQVDHQNDNGWNQGLLFFNQQLVWMQPSAYVTQMMANSYLPQVIQADFESKADTLDVTALKSTDGKTVTVQVVNHTNKLVTAAVVLNNYRGPVNKITANTLKGRGLNDWNTADEPYRIVPIKSNVVKNDSGCDYAFAPYSFTVLRFEGR